MADDPAATDSSPPPRGTKRNADAMGEDSPTQPAQRNTKLVEIVPEADVTLKVGTGDGALDIKVSGLILGLASKVFKTMLNSQFIEGTTRVIELPEDDPRIIMDFAHIIHHKPYLVKDLDAQRLRGLVKLIDLRLCHDSLAPWIVSKLNQYVRWAETVTESTKSLVTMGSEFPAQIPGLLMEDLIAFAAVFDLPEWFSTATRIYQTWAGDPLVPSLKTTTLSRNDLVPVQSCGQCLYALLDETRSQKIHHFLKSIVGFLDTTPTYTGIDYSRTTLPYICKDGAQRYGALVVWLTSSGVNLTDLSQSSNAFGSYFKSVATLVDDKDFGFALALYSNSTASTRQMRSMLKGTDVCPSAACCHEHSDILVELKSILDDQSFDGASLETFRTCGKLFPETTHSSGDDPD